MKNEVKVNVLNQPYGSFPWIDLPMAANENWYNAHNFYGDLKDLDAATLEDVRAFFKTFYSPNNAVLVVTGDFAADQTKAWIQKYFASIPPAKLPPPPDLREPRQEKEKRAERTDALATRPALGIALSPARSVHARVVRVRPDRSGHRPRAPTHCSTTSWCASKGLTGDVNAGINWGLGNMFDYSGPMLWMAQFFHDATTPSDKLLAGIDGVVETVRKEGLDQATLDRARVKMRSGLYANLEQFAGFGRANLLASFALFDDDPSRINRLEEEFAKVTPDDRAKDGAGIPAARQQNGLRRSSRGRRTPATESGHESLAARNPRRRGADAA